MTPAVSGTTTEGSCAEYKHRRAGAPARRGATTRGEPTFEKVGQNDTLVGALPLKVDRNGTLVGALPLKVGRNGTLVGALPLKVGQNGTFSLCDALKSAQNGTLNENQNIITNYS